MVLAPFVVPGVTGGEWIEIKNLIVAEGESVDLVPFLLFVMERSGLGKAIYSDKPMNFMNFDLKVQDHYFFMAPESLIPYYRYLGFEMNSAVQFPGGVRLFTSDRPHYLQQMRSTIQSRKGVSQLACGRWETPGFHESENWRGLTSFQDRDAYLAHLPKGFEGFFGSCNEMVHD